VQGRARSTAGSVDLDPIRRCSERNRRAQRGGEPVKRGGSRLALPTKFLPTARALARARSVRFNVSGIDDLAPVRDPRGITIAGGSQGRAGRLGAPFPRCKNAGRRGGKERIPRVGRGLIYSRCNFQYFSDRDRRGCINLGSVHCCPGVSRGRDPQLLGVPRLFQAAKQSRARARGWNDRYAERGKKATGITHARVRTRRRRRCVCASASASTQ